MIRKLAHLNFVTNDLEKIIDFYVNKLGMKVKFTLDNKEGKPFVKSTRKSNLTRNSDCGLGLYMMRHPDSWRLE